MDHGHAHFSASRGGFLLPAVVDHVNEEKPAGREVPDAPPKVRQAQADTEQAHAGAVGAQEVVGHLAAAVEAAPYVGGLARARIQILEA